MAGKATILMTQVANGEYVVDERAVAEAIVRRACEGRPRRLRVLETPERIADDPIVPVQNRAETGFDAA